MFFTSSISIPRIERQHKFVSSSERSPSERHLLDDLTEPLTAEMKKAIEQMTQLEGARLGEGG